MAAIAAAIGFANKDNLPSICILQVGNCGSPGSSFESSVSNGSSSPLPSPSSSPSNQFISKNKYETKVQAAKTTLSTMPPGLSIQFPMGVQSPIRSGKLGALESKYPSLEVIGYLDRESGQVKPVTPSELLALLDTHAESLYEQVSGNLSPEKTMLASLDLVVIESKNNVVKTVSSVNAGDVVRDAVNSILNATLKESQYNKLVEGLALNR